MSRLLSFALIASLALSPAMTFAGTVVQFDTQLGSFRAELFDDVAPITVANFLSYVLSGEYNGSVIHRAYGIPDGSGGLIPFVLQGGGYYPLPEGSGTEVPAVPSHGAIKNEFIGTPNSRGTLAMALPVNSQTMEADLDGATNQWYINLNDNQDIIFPQEVVVFGQVLGNGMDVVDLLSIQQTFNFGGEFSTLPLLPTYTEAEFLAGDLPLPADWITINVHVVPEPASLVMTIGGAALIGGVLIRRRRARSRRYSRRHSAAH
ncbi:MAG: peptidylprolyl isomerase [Pirellulales bacterium]